MPDAPRLRLYLVHHAPALGPKEDPMQPLSLAGRAWADLAALDAARRGARPAIIWHSGKLRARQTAESFWRACNPLARFAAERGLQPGDPPEWIADRLPAENGELLIVGHMPYLPRLLRLLVTGNPDGAAPEFPAHAVIALEERDGMWSECWRIEKPRWD